MAEPSAADAEDPRLILLDPRDNVLVVRRRIARATRSPSGARSSRRPRDPDGPQGGAPRHRGRREGPEIWRADRHGDGRDRCGRARPRPQRQERLHPDLCARRAQRRREEAGGLAMTGRHHAG